MIMTAVLNAVVRRLLDEPNPAVLATINPDGSPQTSVVWVGRDGDELVISSAAGRRKDRNLGRALAVQLAEEYKGPGAGEAFLQFPPEVIRVVIRIVPEHVAGSAAR
jgi:hypothetical protein